MSTNNIATFDHTTEDDGQGAGSGPLTGRALRLLQRAESIFSMASKFLLELLKLSPASNLNRLLTAVGIFAASTAVIHYLSAPSWLFMIVASLFSVFSVILVAVFIRLLFTKGGFDSDHVALLKVAKEKVIWEDVNGRHREPED